MARLLLLLALCAVFAAAILAGPVAAAKQKPKAPSVPALTTSSGQSSVPVVKGSGSGHMHS
jgi:hypothetical protein